MELFIFIVFQLLTEVQSYKSPTVKVSPDVIRESSSVKISCETPADVRASQCYFTKNREERNIKVSSSCQLELTGAEVLRWAGVKSPESIYINCYYTINERGINKPSSHSPPATVTVLDSLQKPFISVSDNDDQLFISCEIPLSVRVDFICSLYTEDDVLLDHRVSHWSQSGGNLCVFDVSRSELFTQSVNSRQLSCVYSLKTEPEIRSPHSDTYTISNTIPITVTITIRDTNTIRDLPQAKLRASASVILERDTVELSCENTEDLKMEKCYFNINGRESNSKVSSSCQISLTGSQISVWSGGQSSSVRISCFFTVMKGQVQIPSAYSDPVTVTVQVLTSTTTEHMTTTTATTTSQAVMSTSESTTTYSTTNPQSMTILSASTTEETIISTSTTTEHTTTTTATTTSRAVISTSETTTPYSKTNPQSMTITTKETIISMATSTQSALTAVSTAGPTQRSSQINTLWVIVLVSSGVAVILSGLTGFAGLCWFASKKRRKQSKKLNEPIQETGTTGPGPAETYSLITYVPATSQPIAVEITSKVEKDGLKHPESHQDSTADPKDTRSFITSVNPIYQPSDALIDKKRKLRNTEENENVYHLYSTIPDKPVHSNTEDQVYSLLKM
ncbi:serine-rich adhesin for platelets isoform X1 [Carassius gibelio]|uniref:serine-rich adhesin for platelets isoform X1 n=1 Tax=Carassius gibelio TaxID=101364 RepID=UPI0022791F15|nr:serine-rich adhesin for platelets isoform X1 [Carassius gibelio]